uniref:P2X purinoceptor n=1 Tax=Takifugu rubripes TaxID=31033 RepID=A0A674PPF2_TAKRU
MSCCVRSLCQYETNKLVRIQSVRLGSMKWSLNGFILLFICVMMTWNRKYQEFDLVVSSVTTKVKGVAQTNLPGVGEVVWDVVDYSGPAAQSKNSFFVLTNVLVTRNQKQGKCPEIPQNGRLCNKDQDCKKGYSDLHSHGIQTGSCVRFDALKKTCEVSAWCPIETKNKPPRPALLTAAENFTVLIKNNIRFPAFNYTRRNILPKMSDTYLKNCHRKNDSLCPIFRLGDMVREAGENFQEMAVEKFFLRMMCLLFLNQPQGGVIGIQIKWDCNLDVVRSHCLPRYSFRRLDEKESNRTLYPGLNFRYAKYNTVNGVEERTLYKAFGIRFDVMVFGQAGRFSFIQLIIYVGSTLSYYALCFSFLAFTHKWNHLLQEDIGHLRAALSLLQSGATSDCPPDIKPRPQTVPPAWCKCACCVLTSVPHEELCCRRSDGACITSSPLFELLVLRRSTLEAALLYRDPLDPPTGPGQTTTLRHCAYRQYIFWRFGEQADGSHPVIPSCCVWRIREEYPSLDRRYSGFRPEQTTNIQVISNGEVSEA